MKQKLLFNMEKYESAEFLLKWKQLNLSQKWIRIMHFRPMVFSIVKWASLAAKTYRSCWIKINYFLDEYDRTKNRICYKTEQYPEKTYREIKRFSDNAGYGRHPVNLPFLLRLISSSLACSIRLQSGYS